MMTQRVLPEDSTGGLGPLGTVNSLTELIRSEYREQEDIRKL
jgi:hypothetical protein